MQAARYTDDSDFMTSYERIFGTGPRGIFVTIATFAIAYTAVDRYGPWGMHGISILGYGALAISLAMTLFVAAWSLQSLPPADRGKALVTSGAFRYFRHPLYASFLTFFDFGFALYLDDWIFLGWAIAQHPIWHLNILGEERLMRNEFGAEYDVYCGRRGRFVPRFWPGHSPG